MGDPRMEDLSLKEVQDQYNLRHEDVVTYFFKQVQEYPGNKHALLAELDQWYFAVRPKLNQYFLRQLLFGNMDTRQGTLISTESQELLSGPPRGMHNLGVVTQPQGLFLLISDHKNASLCASSAAKLLAKLLDFQKNPQAEGITRELGRVSSDFFSKFGIEELLKWDSSKKSILNIYKAYTSTREGFVSIEQILDELIVAVEARREVQSFIESSKKLKRDNTSSSRKLNIKRGDSFLVQRSSDFSTGVAPKVSGSDLTMNSFMESTRLRKKVKSQSNCTPSETENSSTNPVNSG